MSQRMRVVWMVGVFMLVLLAGWRIVGLMRTEALAEQDPPAALRWRPDAPAALQVLAERQLAAGDLEAAAATARRILAQSPLHGPAFRILAEVAERHDDPAQAERLYQIAARRAPRDAVSRLWLARHALQRGQFDEALQQLDRLLRFSPQRAAVVFPALIQMATQPAFADALARQLAHDPPWRGSLLAALQRPASGNPEAAGRVLEALQAQGGLQPEEYARWLDALLAQGCWGEAYARWASRVPKPDGRLPLLYNGDFAMPPTNVGFDWRIQRVPGVLLDFVPVAGARGQAAYFSFLDRRIPEAGLSHPLLLAPGHYQITLKARATALRSELGLQWQLVCADPAGVLARSDPLDGNFGWTRFVLDVEVPATGCPGQWLRLVNPVPNGAAQRLSGELWVTDVTVRPGLNAH